MKRILIILSTLMSLMIVSCSEPKPQPIAYGTAQCAACRMGITDQKFGSELVTTKGKTYVFDSPECMIEFAEGGTVAKDEIHSLWVTDFLQPGTLIDARTAWYLESDMIHSPMGLNVAAFRDEHACERARVNFVGTPRRYADVVDLVMN
jgi:copper chaperone NosL